MILSLIFIIVAMLMGVALRKKVSAFRRLHIPAPVLAGCFGLLAIQLAKHLGSGTLATVLESVNQTLRDWPSWLIAVVFAGMMLERQSNNDQGTPGRVARQGLMVWIIVLGETAVGLLATWLFIQPWFDVPNSFGMLIETGFAGGHGTAAAMGQVYLHPSIAFPEGQDLGVLMATCGLVYGIVSGIAWINVAARGDWLSRSNPAARDAHAGLSGRLAPKTNGVLKTKIPGQLLWLGIAFSIGWLLQGSVQQVAGMMDRLSDPSASIASASVSPGSTDAVGVTTTNTTEATSVEQASTSLLADRLLPSQLLDFPLFIYTLFGGLIARRAFIASGQEHQLHPATIGFVTGIAMDVLIVAAMASLNIAAAIKLLAPFSVLLICGLAWTSFCLLYLSRVILRRDDWFELGLINYGMSTGTTATGFVLLRVIDPHLKTNAASDYALAVPLSAPFVGGGIVTVALPLLLLPHVSLAWPAIGISFIVVAMILCGRQR